MNEIASLLPVVVAAYTVQTAIGFGSAIVALTLGSYLLPLPSLLALFVPLSLVQTGYLSVAHRGDVDWRWLLRRVLPLMGIGMLAGFWGSISVDPTSLRRGFGALVLVLAVHEFISFGRAPAPDARSPLSASILGAGVMHGIAAAGGPLLVYAAGRRAMSPPAFRATLWTVWVTLNAVLTTQYCLVGRVDWATLTTAAFLVPGIPLGILLGKRLHRHIDGERFRLVVFGSLAVAALGLLLR